MLPYLPTKAEPSRRNTLIPNFAEYVKMCVWVSPGVYGFGPTYKNQTGPRYK